MSYGRRPSIPPLPDFQGREQRFQQAYREVVEKYEIHADMAKRLEQLLDFEIVIVCDDSGSMITPVAPSNRTRWDLLCDIVKIILEIGVVFDSNGVDIYFLNQAPLLRVKSLDEVNEIFSRKPRGFTPLVPILKNIFKLPTTRIGSDKKLLVFIATDGAPTDIHDKENVPELEHLMNHGRQVQTTHVHFLACTDDPIAVQYLRGWDRSMVNVDVTLDFLQQREDIRRHRGANYPFSFGDYVVKALVGAIDPVIDQLDEEDEDKILPS